MMLTIDVLGPLVVRCDGGTRKLPRKAKALVVFLLMSGRPVPRARLADLLWPYQGNEQARHSLRKCLLELRKVADRDDGILRSDFTDCSIGERVTGDFHRFALLAQPAAGSPDERQDLLAACEIYRGAFLDGFDIASEPWNEWVAGMREELQNCATGALLRLSQLSTSAGLHSEAVAAARRLVHIDPLVERFHRRLMRALADGGRRSEAIQVYKRLETDLRRELAVRPDANTRQLLHEIAGARSGEPPVLPPVLPPVWPRAAEPVMLDDLTAQLEKLGSAMVDWDPSKRGLTLGMIKRAGEAMLAAADDRRRAAAGRVPEVLTEPEFEYRVQVPAPSRELVATWPRARDNPGRSARF
jgi:DNA-binding SARP family transcriptional activator